MERLIAFGSSLLGRLLLAAAAIVLVLFAVNSCNSARNAGKEARLANETGRAATSNAIDAVAAAGGVSARDAQGDSLTRENDNAIHSAEGAGTVVPAAVAAAGLDGLCQRRVYRCERQCLQRAAAAGVADPGAGCPAAGE